MPVNTNRVRAEMEHLEAILTALDYLAPEDSPQFHQQRAADCLNRMADALGLVKKG